MNVLIPIVPHLSHECLQQLGVKDIDTWPKVDDKLVLDEKIKIAIQINGKTREIIEVRKDATEKDVVDESKKIKKINDQLIKTQIKRTIFVRNKVINYLTY